MGLVPAAGPNNALPFACLFWAQTRIGGRWQLNATTPLFTVILAHFFTRDERMTPLKVLGCVVGVVGVGVMVGREAFSDEGGVLAYAAVLGAGLLRRGGHRPSRQTHAALASPRPAHSRGGCNVPAALLVDQPTAGTGEPLLALAHGAGQHSVSLCAVLAAEQAGATNILLVTLLIR